VTLLEAPEPPFRPASNSLLPDSVARLVSAATVDATLAAEVAVELDAPLAAAVVTPATEFCAEAALDALKRLDRTEAWLLPTLPIDIMPPPANRWNQVYRPMFQELEGAACGDAARYGALLGSSASSPALFANAQAPTDSRMRPTMWAAVQTPPFRAK
jgi:hypothetical protein